MEFLLLIQICWQLFDGENGRVNDDASGLSVDVAYLLVSVIAADNNGISSRFEWFVWWREFVFTVIGVVNFVSAFFNKRIELSISF